MWQCLLFAWVFLFCEATRILAEGQFIDEVEIPRRVPRLEISSVEKLSLKELKSTSHYQSSRRTRTVQSSDFSTTTVIREHDLVLAQWAGQPIPVSVLKLLEFELNLYPAFDCDCKGHQQSSKKQSIQVWENGIDMM